MYALGVLLYTMIFGFHPYVLSNPIVQNYIALAEMIKNGPLVLET